MPSGLQRVESRQRTVVLADALDPFSMNSFEETVTVNGRITRRKYLPATRTFTTTSKQGRINLRELDVSGRVVRTQSGGLLPFIYSYNNDGFLQTTTRGSRVVQYHYFTTGPAAGTLESILDPGSQLTTLTRDALGRITSAERAAAVTSFAWDNNSNLVSVTPPGKPAHAMQYTPVNLLSDYQPPFVTGVSTPQTTYSYDLDRAIDEITRPDGMVIDHTYDAAGRLELVSAPGATITQSYYPAPADPSIIPPGEAPGRLQSVSGPYGTLLTYIYDGRLPLSETVSGAVTGAVSWTYNADLVHTSQSVTTGSGTTTTAYGYDGDLLTTCASPTTCPSGSNALTLTRGSQHGLVTALTQGSVNETWSYNSYGELASKVAAFGGTQLVRVVYDAPGATRDGQGRVVQKTVTRGGIAKPHQYTYDNLGRLSTVSLNGVLAEEYTYDENGNRLTAFEQGAGTSTAYYDDQDRLLSYGDYEYSDWVN